MEVKIIGKSFTPAFLPVKNYNSKPVTEATTNKIAFGMNVTQAKELAFEPILTLAQKIDGKELEPIVQEGLKALLDNGKRVLKYDYVPSAIHTHQFVLGKPGLNAYNNPCRTFVETGFEYGLSFGEVNGSGNLISDAIKALIQKSKTGAGILVD